MIGLSRMGRPGSIAFNSLIKEEKGKKRGNLLLFLRM